MGVCLEEGRGTARWDAPTATAPNRQSMMRRSTAWPEYKLFLRDVENSARSSRDVAIRLPSSPTPFAISARSAQTRILSSIPFFWLLEATRRTNSCTNSLRTLIRRSAYRQYEAGTSHCGAHQNDHEGPTGGSCRNRGGQACRNGRGGVSKAPAPAPALNSSTSKTVDWRDDQVV